MNRWLLSLGALLLALLAASHWQNQHLQQTLDHQQQRLGAAQATLTARDAQISQLEQQLQQRERAELALRQALSGAQGLTLQREQRLQELLSENKKLRDWYRTGLPDDVIRLHQRPTFTKPGDYLRWLSESQQLPHSR